MGGSSHEPPSKKEKKELQRRVNHIGVQGPFIKTRWSHMPITFSQDDLRLKDYPHNDAMVINYNIGGYIIHDVLVDNGSAADILMAKAFRQMNLGDSVLEPATNPLCGFGGEKWRRSAKSHCKSPSGRLTMQGLSASERSKQATRGG